MSQYAKDGRILYIDRIRECYIMYKDKAIGKLIHEFSSISGDEDWLIVPFWDVVDSFGGEVRIPGIDGVNRKEKYIRLYTPVIVTQRTIPQSHTRNTQIRDKLYDLGMHSYDLFEFMCRSHAFTLENEVYISRTPDKIVDLNNSDGEIEYDIPNFDTDDYGWIKDYINKE